MAVVCHRGRHSRAACACVSTLFFAQGDAVVSRGCERLTSLACPKGVTTTDPCAFFAAPPRSRLRVPSPALSPETPRKVWFSVRHSRAGRMRVQNAVLPHSHGEGPQVSRFNGTGSSSLALGGTAAVFLCQGLRGTAASPKVRYCRSP